jgi:acyl-CoA thioester hydrolase
MRVVYHANYFVWFEIGRVELLRSLGWSYRTLEEQGISLPVITATCRYRHPARYDDELEVRTNARLVSALRVGFSYHLMRTADDLLLAEAETEHVPLNSAGRPCRLPTGLRETFL